MVWKEKRTAVITGTDLAGLDICASYPEALRSPDGELLGVRQSKVDGQIGIFVGVLLASYGDYVTRHYVEAFDELQVVKRWDLSTTTTTTEKGDESNEGQKLTSVGSNNHYCIIVAIPYTVVLRLE